jgi:hypothetical protein
MVNILIGWGIDYIILNFGNVEERAVHEQLRQEQYDNKIDLARKQMLFLEEFQDTEDLFSTIDFKKFVVKVREGITVKNSDYLKDNNYSRAILASSFLQEVGSGNVSFDKLDDETRENMNSFYPATGWHAQLNRILGLHENTDQNSLPGLDIGQQPGIQGTGYPIVVPSHSL